MQSSLWLHSVEKPWRAATDTPASEGPVTMLLPLEIRALEWLAENATGIGCIAELGTFIGGSTCALARGLLRNPAPLAKTARIHSYDRFVHIGKNMGTYMARDAMGSQAGEDDRAFGASFVNIYTRNIAPYADRVVVNNCDILKARWSGRPIEILFLDICKSFHLSDHVTAEFFPSLVPQHSILVQQDYLDFRVPWIHVTMEYFHDHFEMVDLIWGGSAVFRCLEPIPQEKLAAPIRYALPAHRQLALMDKAIERMAVPAERRMLELSKALLVSDLHGVAAAIQYVEQRAATYGDDTHASGCAQEMLENLRKQAG